MLRRKSLLAVCWLTLALLAASCSGQTAPGPTSGDQANQGSQGPQATQTNQETKLTEVTFTGLNGIQAFPFVVMQKLRLDEKHGLKVKVDLAPSPTGMYTRLRANEAHFGGSAWVTIADWYTKGVGWTNIYPFGGSGNDIIVKKDSPIQSLGDLKGKKIGSYSSASGTANVLLRVILRKAAGFDPHNDGHLLYLSPSVLFTQLASGELDAILLNDPAAVRLLATDDYRSIGNVADLYKEHFGITPVLVVVSTREEYAEANPDVVRRFIAAVDESVQFLNQDTEIWKELAATENITDPKAVELLRKRLTVDYPYQSAWDDAAIESQIKMIDQAVSILGREATKDMFAYPLPREAFTNAYIPKK